MCILRPPSAKELSQIRKSSAADLQTAGSASSQDKSVAGTDAAGESVQQWLQINDFHARSDRKSQKMDVSWVWGCVCTRPQRRCDLSGRDTGNNLELFTLLKTNVWVSFSPHKQQLITRLLPVPVEPVMRRVCRSILSFRDPGVQKPDVMEEHWAVCQERWTILGWWDAPGAAAIYGELLLNFPVKSKLISRNVRFWSSGAASPKTFSHLDVLNF